MIMDPDPPFEETYRSLLLTASTEPQQFQPTMSATDMVVKECELPVIDLGRLLKKKEEEEEEDCKREMARASREWGFFQVINHGIPQEVLQAMREEQVRAFRQPFYKKMKDDGLSVGVNSLAGSYRWGTPSATRLDQLSWSEAFHIPLTGGQAGISGLSSSMRRFADSVSELAQRLVCILVEMLGGNDTDLSFFRENCTPNTCYLRMNRYPPCPNYGHLFGLMPHTDSDFLTVLYQDEVGGLQLVKDSRWIAVKPNPQALIINIGDLFQAWSNGVYKSVEHRVVANQKVERFSTAYFLCPSSDAVIQSYNKDRRSVYKNFSFREYKQQVQDDVKMLGHKVGLSRFFVCPSN